MLFLEKINRLTPIQSSRKNYKNFSFKKKKDYQILKETKILHQKRKDLSKIQIIEFSILFIILNYFKFASKKIEDLSEIEFLSDKNESFFKNNGFGWYMIIYTSSSFVEFDLLNKDVCSLFKK